MVLKGLQKCFRAFSGEEISCSLTGLTYFHFPPTIRCAIIVEPDILIRFKAYSEISEIDLTKKFSTQFKCYFYGGTRESMIFFQ